MTKVTLADVPNLIDATTAAATINSNSAATVAAIEKTLSRDGTSPNQMEAPLDMNSNRIVNLPAPLTVNEPVRLVDLNTIIGGGTITVQPLPAGGTTGQVLAKNSNTNYDAGWTGSVTSIGGASGAITLGTGLTVVGSTLSTNLPPSRGYLSGLTLSNNAVTPASKLDVSAGVACASDESAMMTLASSITKDISSTWVVGNGNGGLDTGAVSNTTYHVFLIQRSDTLVVDVLFSLSATAPTMPTNYNRKRRIGSIIRSGSAILNFVQIGDYFKLNTTVIDYNTVANSTDILITVTAPSGIKTQHVGFFDATATGASTFLALLSDGGNTTAQNTIARISLSNDVSLQQSTGFFTNTAAQLRYTSSFTGTITHRVWTSGWIDGLDR